VSSSSVQWGMALTFCEDAVEEGCDELAELDALPERLRLERYDLKRKINRFHSAIVRQLPPDVTSTIFEFCLPDFADHQLSPFTKEDSVPLSLGAICSYWREIAWSTPSLWSSLVVRVSSKHDSHIVTGIAQEWLARSGQLPLSICILAKPAYNQFSALADIINQYSSRWSNLDLYMPQRYYQCLHASAPILKSIRFHCSGFDGRTLDFPLTCPRLERAHLSSFQVDVTNIQWDNLTHLTLLSMSIINTFLILRKTPRLVFCKISGSHSRYGDPIGASVLTLASLRSLQLITIFAKDFLNNLIAPHLEEFSLPKYYNPSMEVSMEVITSFLKRSAVHGPLHVLKLDRYPATRIPRNRISYVSSLVEQGVTVNVLSESEDILQPFLHSHKPEMWAIQCYRVSGDVHGRDC
jgi:hypothetical protein